MLRQLAMDRIEYSEPIEVGSTLPIIAKDVLMVRLEEACTFDYPIRFGLISCMPSLDMSSIGLGELKYNFGPSGYKAAVDIKSGDLASWKRSVEEDLGIAISLECLVADTEARVKSDGLLIPNRKDAISIIANKVVKRVSK